MARASSGVLALLMVAAMACGDDDASPGAPDGRAPPGVRVQSSKPRLTAAVPAADTQDLTRDNASFAFDVLGRTATNENFFFSPHSLSLALAMTYGGAHERTATQMAQALRWTLPAERLHAAFGALDLELGRRGDKPVESGHAFELRILDAAWGQRGHVFLSSYLDLLAEHYGAGLNLLDFGSDPEGSRTAINRWVSQSTEARIPELLPAGLISPATVLVLTNAISFTASWKNPFDPAQTSERTFVGLDGQATNVPMMHQVRELRYAEGEGWQALELPYSGDEVSMIAILPGAGAFESFRATLDGAKLGSIAGALGSRMTDVSLPRFRFRTQLPVKPTLQALGMTDAFTPGTADLSGMDGTKSLFIEDVIHEAFVAVDERGTEAAAATAVVVGRVSAPEPATFTADRPFLVVIRDNPTGAVLFAGQVTRP